MRIFLAVLLCAGSTFAASIAAPAFADVATPPKPDSKSELEQLLTALPLAPSEDVAARMESRIGQLWLKAGGPAAGLLIAKGSKNLQSGDAREAVQDFDAALALSPDFTEAFERRALARYQSGNVSGALRDLEETVRREPRNFAAWRSLSVIAEAQGNWKGALAAWRKLLDVDPRTAGAQSRLKELTRRAEGEES